MILYPQNKIANKREIEDAELAAIYWQSGFNGEPWPIERRVTAFLNNYGSYDSPEFDRFLNVVVATRPGA